MANIALPNIHPYIEKLVLPYFSWWSHIYALSHSAIYVNFIDTPTFFVKVDNDTNVSFGLTSLQYMSDKFKTLYDLYDYDISDLDVYTVDNEKYSLAMCDFKIITHDNLSNVSNLIAVLEKSTCKSDDVIDILRKLYSSSLPINFLFILSSASTQQIDEIITSSDPAITFQHILL